METKTYNTFEEKVRSMTGREIIETMIAGLEREWVKVKMQTFGDVYWGSEYSGPICVGCAATNFLCELNGKPFNIHNILGSTNRSVASNAESRQFFQQFELAIDQLRRGNIMEYNALAKLGGYATIKGCAELFLPYMQDYNYKASLRAYKKLAAYQDSNNHTNEERATQEEPTKQSIS